MATAEAKARRKEEESRSQDDSPAETSQRSSRSRRGGTRQLDFFQAMSDFRQMFPTLEDEVIEAVLRANDGAVDATIDQLLTMTIDIDVTETVATSEAAMPLDAFCPHYDEQDKPANPRIEDSPPSYSEAMRSQSQVDEAQSIWTTPIGQPCLTTKNIHDLDVDSFSRALSNTEPKGAMAQLSPRRLPSTTGRGYSPQRTDSSTVSGASQMWKSASDQSIQNTRRKNEFRNWNPPMLGNLPDDFLRLIPPDTQLGSPSAKPEMDRLSNISTTPINVLSLTDVKPKVHKTRSKSEKMSRSFSGSPKDAKEKDSKSKNSDRKSKPSDKMSRSMALSEESPERRGHKASRSQSERLSDKSSRRNMNSSLSPSHHSVIIETHDFSKNMLDERMKENERRRKRTSAEFDPEMAQYLEDERMAIALQNSEFLQELRGNEDFMKTLQRDRLETPPLETPVPEVPLRPSYDVHEGYGDDAEKTLGAFPFSQNIAKDKDEDAELRKQLTGMGRASRKQLSSLARKFFRRKKKTSKQILGEKLAPSMMNLLEDDDDEEEDDTPIDSRYGSPPEIEPLPSSLIGVPSHRTVQRPPYQTDGVTTYYDNKHTDMV